MSGHALGRADDIVEERRRASLEPAAYEAVAAARLGPPGAERGFRPARGDPTNTRVPTLIVGGDCDLLREPWCPVGHACAEAGCRHGC